MESSRTNIIGMVERIILLIESQGPQLYDGPVHFFREVLKQLHVPYELELYKIAENIRLVYGGMGSFSDLVLHKDGKPLQVENDELEKLKNELFNECMKVITISRGLL